MAVAVLYANIAAGMESGKSAGKEENPAGELKQDMSVQHEKLNLELGRLYFLELANYEKSREHFEKVKKDKLAESMAVIAECMEENIQDYKLRKALESAENELLLQEDMDTDEKTEYYQCILRGYSILAEEADAENVIRIGKICIRQEEVEKRTEIIGFMAAAYEKLGKAKEAGSMYEEQIKVEEDSEIKEEIYKKAVTVYEQAGQTEQALELCRAGIDEFHQSEELRTIYIRILLKDSNIDRKICIQNIKEQLKACPELNEQEEFQKLMKEHGVTVEGEKVWEKKEE